MGTIVFYNIGQAKNSLPKAVATGYIYIIYMCVCPEDGVGRCMHDTREAMAIPGTSHLRQIAI